MPTPNAGLTRRSTLTAGALAGFASLLGARLAFADEKMVMAEIKKLYGDKTMAEGKIKLDIPEIAENGLVVPVNVEVDSPMTEADYVKAVHIYADGNP
ncbi:thiosulfate oxidation carrier protein SoxY, partial [Methylobacterium sp. CCH7-A2]